MLAVKRATDQSPSMTAPSTAASDFESRARALIADYPDRLPLRAAAFIVTLYGDVVVPRGGTLWIGNVIEACAEVGISETLVRTAVSRLVAAGRLTGSKAGRRSFYSLTPAARDEFERAAEILYAGPDEAETDDWTVVMAAGADGRTAVEALARQGFGLAAPGVALRPGDTAPTTADAAPGLLVFQARLTGTTSGETLRDLAAAAWDLPALAAEYDGFVALFGPVAAALDDAGPGRLDGALALAVRLLLVHAFRRTALRDPRLPATALPAEWSGRTARRLFGTVYRALSPDADDHVARRFVDGDGPVAVDAERLRRRLRNLSETGDRPIGRMAS
jgi:phenylacetic acid degradation operon negative regulatory protein